jgi:predicted nucleotidyltransferase
MLGDPAILDQTLTPAERRVLDDLAGRIKERYGERLDRLQVFGSRARGDAHEESDIDLLVVLRVPREAEDRETTAVWALVEAAMTSQHTAAPLSVIVFAEDRFAEMWAQERRFALDVEAEGIRL